MNAHDAAFVKGLRIGMMIAGRNDPTLDPEARNMVDEAIAKLPEPVLKLTSQFLDTVMDKVRANPKLPIS